VMRRARGQTQDASERDGANPHDRNNTSAQAPW
jgi:hypothetical protein